MPLTDEAREMFGEHIAKWFDEHDVPSDLRTMVFDPTIKPQAVVRVRDELIEWLRTRCWQYGKQSHGLIVDQTPEDVGSSRLGWIPLSYPNIAEILHLRNHTTVLVSLKRTREKRRTEKLRACRAPREWDGVPVDVGGYIE